MTEDYHLERIRDAARFVKLYREKGCPALADTIVRRETNRIEKRTPEINAALRALENANHTPLG